MKLKYNIDTNKFEQHLQQEEKPQQIVDSQRNKAKREAMRSLYKPAIDSIEQSLADPTIDDTQLKNLLNRYNNLQDQLKKELEDN